MSYSKTICYFLLIINFGLSALGADEMEKEKREERVDYLLKNYEPATRDYLKKRLKEVEQQERERLSDDNTYEEQMLYYITHEPFKFERVYFYYPQKNTPQLIKKFADATLKLSYLATFTFLVANNPYMFSYVFDIDKCSEYMLSKLISTYVIHADPIDPSFSAVFLEKAWESGDANKFKLVINKLLKHPEWQTYLDILIEKIKLDYEAKKDEILRILLNNIAKEQRAYLLDHLPLPYLVPYRLHDIIKSKINHENINTPDDKGYTPLHRAIIQNDVFLTKHLLKEGAGSHIIDCDKLLLPFYWAITKGTTAALDTVLKWLKDNNHLALKDAIAWAAYYKRPELIYYFLDKGLDPNEQDTNGNTFTHIALFYDMPDLLPILNKFNDSIDYTKINNSNESMLDYAKNSGNKKYINFIKKRLNNYKKKRKADQILTSSPTKRQKNK